MSKRDRRSDDDEEGGNERWLVTYADMVTLLMVLFIVLFAMSQVDQAKYESLRDGLTAGFGQSPAVLDGSTSILADQGSAVSKPISPPEQVNGLTPRTNQADLDEAVSKNERLRNQRKYAEAEAEASRLEKIERKIMAALAKHHLKADVQSTIDNRGLTVSLMSKHVVFQPNIAVLTARGRLIVDTMAPVLRDLTDPLEIDGHTNQVKVKPKFYPTDWDLSSARAISVLRHLNERGGISDNRLSAVGYGHTKPLVDLDKPGSQRVNKRVDIVVLPRVLDEARQMLQQAALEQAAHRKERS